MELPFRFISNLSECSCKDVFRSNPLKDILDKISFGYFCQIITPTTFKQYIACTGLKVRFPLVRDPKRWNLSIF